MVAKGLQQPSVLSSAHQSVGSLSQEPYHQGWHHEGGQLSLNQYGECSLPAKCREKHNLTCSAFDNMRPSNISVVQVHVGNCYTSVHIFYAILINTSHIVNKIQYHKCEGQLQ